MDQEEFDYFVMLLGEEKTTKLVECFKGSSVYFSFPKRMQTHDKKKLIHELHRRHVPVANIAKRVGYSRSHIYRILRESHVVSPH